MRDIKKNKIVSFICAHFFDILFGVPSLVPVINWLRCIIYKIDYTSLELLLSAIILVMSLLWFLLIRGYFVAPTPCIKTQYSYESKTLKYDRDDKNDTLTFKKSASIKSNVNGLVGIDDRFIWTGAENINLPEKGKNVSSIHLNVSRGIWTYFTVRFKETLSKGDTIKIGYKWNKIQRCQSSSPFVSTDTEYATKLIVFDINLGKEYANRELYLEEFRSIDSEDCPIDVVHVRFDEFGRYRWEISRPSRYRYFRVRWEWINGESVEEDM